jgi:flavin-binding protein dodecin
MGEIGKITEIMSSSNKSFEDAISKAVARLQEKGEKDIRGLKVKNVSVSVKDGKIAEWRVNLKVSSEF